MDYFKVVLKHFLKNMKYKCLNCDYIYDEEKEGLNFKGLNAEWICPECGVSKSDFELLVEEENEEINSEIEDDEGFLKDESETGRAEIDDNEFKGEDY